MTQMLEWIDTVLLDIEGTICPIDFVKETLFPYAINALPEVLKTQWNDPEFAQYRDAFPEDARSSPEALEGHVRDLTKRDVKVAYLKNLQGYLWQSGFESGAYSAPLFEDVLSEMQRWHNKGIKSSIYSSGSIFAQKLLFGHIKDDASQDPKATVDRRDLIQEWFDTTNAGPKTEKASYEKIAHMLGKEPGKVLFLSDNVKEIGAALQAGMKAIVVDRPGNVELSMRDWEKYEMVTSFEQIKL
ncbi:enolase-phosphatase E1 [Knufia fluminis]|uniref:Enolase-phosphatase E1 n=1 Tax=Knufia fluminis TaxID=191047 RepID=A0AAN8EPP4_9EURO|nr:enolase-phosphatase E1 [Knufia fluminis]